MEDIRPRLGSAVIVEKDGKVLLGERNKENYRGYWVLPGGGVEWGETIEQAAVREIKEETGLDIELIRFVCHKEIIATHANYHSIVFYHLARPRNTEIRVSDDLSDAGFFSVEEMKKMKLAESAVMVLKEAGMWK